MSTTPQPGSSIPPAPAPFPPPRGHGEKEEEKRHGKDEKSQEETWRRDPLSAMVWAVILIWAGVVLLLNNAGMLPFVPGLPSGPWSLIFAGAGVIILVEVFIRLVLPQYRRVVIGSLLVAFVFIGIGVGAGGTLGWGCSGVFCSLPLAPPCS